MLRILFSKYGLFCAVYVLIGVFANPAAPHLPVAPGTTGGLHSWVQWGISVMFWPLSIWHPAFTTAKWHP